MADLWLKDVLLDGKTVQVLVAGGRFSYIGNDLPAEPPAKVIDGRSRMAIVLPFYNTHTHSAMTLLRGYADDLELFTWLNEHIWPLEAKLSGEDVRIGSRLAALEMIKSGTVFFNDMYWFQAPTLETAEEFGMRAAVGRMFLTGPDGKLAESSIFCNTELVERAATASHRVEITLAPHAVYTVPENMLQEIAAESAAGNIRIHTHVSETAKEVADCREAHGGLTPVEYLDRLGIINERAVLAHCVHLTDRDIEIIAERGATISHQPVSNMKLVSGMFRFKDAAAAGCRIAIGTDGCASNNHLSIFNEMKFAALCAKMQSGDPTAATAASVWQCATVNGAAAFGIDCGIEVGKVADAMLIDLDRPEMVADYNLVSNLVYSAHPEAVDTVICDGNVLMEHRVVPGEEEILNSARELCRDLLRRK